MTTTSTATTTRETTPEPNSASFSSSATTPRSGPLPEDIRASLDALKGQRVAVALSGGVDSAVAGLLLKRAGCEVIGLALRLHDADPTLPTAPRACCAPDDLQDARRVCEALDAPFYVLDAREKFERDVVEPFVAGYFGGRTPSPCVACNSKVKLEVLWRRAKLLGATALATGHYARLDRSVRPVRLFRGSDLAKDQAYFLFATPPSVLADLVFPLGAMSKDGVRALALEAGLPVAHKLDSQEVCFVGGAGAKDFLARRAKGRVDGSGRLIDDEGHALGTHDGFWQFTVGQRRGTNFAGGRRLYVLNVDATTNDVTLAADEALLGRALLGRNAQWVEGPPTSPQRAIVKIRSRDPGTWASVEPQGDAVTVRFEAPVRAIAPGQVAVFFDGDRVVGGATIERALP